ncbi:hypothetical protein LXA47_31345 [Massilia sp. P8910]|uniref:hypothetical protein n=1 Tax=Massilia antarctica TaxID=2765360 RepID=UPI001E439F58|nr:hypothetical protein [Massilia antarctica]MCE3608067.1 hypothetical protein [Massilia antarctica]
MGIQNFPAALVPLIQQNFLEAEFSGGLTSRLGFRDIADREMVSVGKGETITKTRNGLKAPVTGPMNPANNTNLDNGLTASGWTVEQYVLAINMYGDTQDLNIVTSKVGIGDQFLTNANVSGVQAAQSLERFARNKLFDAYMSGNTRVTATLGAPGTAVAVDDIRGFQTVFSNGVQVSVSVSNPMLVTINGASYTLTAATADGSNTSSLAAYGGISGVLTLSANVSVANATAANAVVSAVAPSVIRAGGKLTTAALAAGTDRMKMQDCLDAVAVLRGNNTPTVRGLYNCYLSDAQMLQLFRDDDFKLLYRGAYESKEYRQGQVIELAGLRFITTNEVITQTLAGVVIHRAIICGAGALVEGTFEGQTAALQMDMDEGLVQVVDGVVQVTREPLDRLKQIISQSWFSIKGWAVPTDITANTSIIPTATNSYFKRAVIIESAK